MIDKTIEDIMSVSMITFGLASMSRYLPSNIDGLKPGQRRILYTMYMKDNNEFNKCVSIVGRASDFVDTGDAGIYQALVYMAQKDRHIHPLIEGQGNFGYIIDSLDSYAASRYTEAKLSQYTKDFYFTDDFKYTLFKDNYIGTKKEPVVLPTLLPMAIIHGSKGIAYAASNSVLPLDLISVAESYKTFLKCKNDKKNVNNNREKILSTLKFNTANNSIIESVSNDLFKTGRGSVTIRGEAHTDAGDYGRTRIVITKLPYLSAIPKFIEKLKTMPDSLFNLVADIADESSKEGCRIIITLKKGVNPNVILEYLYTSGIGFKAGGGLKEVVRSNYKYFSFKHKKVVEYDIIRLYEEHFEFKMLTLDRYFEAMITEATKKLNELEAILYIISDKSRLDKFFDTIKKSTRETLGKNLAKAFKMLSEEILLYISEKKFTIMLKNSEEIKNKIFELKALLKEYQYNREHKIDYLIKEIDTKIKKYK